MIVRLLNLNLEANVGYLRPERSTSSLLNDYSISNTERPARLGRPFHAKFNASCLA